MLVVPHSFENERWRGGEKGFIQPLGLKIYTLQRSMSFVILRSTENASLVVVVTLLFSLTHFLVVLGKLVTIYFYS